jgi:hypothetical protein
MLAWILNLDFAASGSGGGLLKRHIQFSPFWYRSWLGP